MSLRRTYALFFSLVFSLALGCGGGSGPGPMPEDERCDGLDQDIDGLVDESATCGSAQNAASTACVAGECRVVTCAAGFSDCDQSLANGCEANHLARATCGGCGGCEEASACSEGVCVPIEEVVFGGSGDQDAQQLVVLSSGDLALTGRFMQSATFPATTYTGGHVPHPFVWSFSPQLEHRWLTVATAGAATYGSEARISDVAPTPDGGAYVVGGFRTSMSFGTLSVSTTGFQEAFVGKLGSDGALVWLTKPAIPTSSLNSSYGHAIASTANGPVVGGSYVYSGNDRAGFITRLSGAGVHLSNGRGATPSILRVDGTNLLSAGGFTAGPYLSPSQSVFVDRFVGNANSVLTSLFIRDIPDQSEYLGSMIRLADGGIALSYAGDRESAIEVHDDAVQRWRVPVSASNGAFLLEQGSLVYAITTGPVTIGTRTFSVEDVPMTTIVALDIEDGSIEWSAEVSLGSLIISGALFTPDGRLWLAGDIGRQADPMGIEMFLVSMDLTTL